MECTLVPASELSIQHRALWSDFLSLNVEYDAPSFYPEFVCGMGQYIPECKIAILHRGSKILGYLPFSTISNERIARAIPMCDYQAIIGIPRVEWNMRGVLRAAGLRSWIFENLPRHQLPSEATYMSTGLSPRVHLEEGFERYRAELVAAGKSARNILNKIKRLERRYGPLTLIHDVADRPALTRLLELKAERFAPREGFPDWVNSTLGYFHRRRRGSVTGMLSVLKASDENVAYLLSLKVKDLLYYWFPAFEPKYREYSPGMILVWLLIRDLNALGCTKIDFGPGEEIYKQYFANRWLEIGSGRLDTNDVVAAARRFYRYFEHRLRSSAAAQKYIKPVVRKLRVG